MLVILTVAVCVWFVITILYVLTSIRYRRAHEKLHDELEETFAELLTSGPDDNPEDRKRGGWVSNWRD